MSADDECFDVAEAAMLQEEDDEHVERGEETPQISGRWKSRLSAMAAPMTSARSQAAIAISQRIQRKMVVGRE